MPTALADAAHLRDGLLEREWTRARGRPTLGREVHELVDVDGLGDALEGRAAHGMEAKGRLVKRAIDTRGHADATRLRDGLDAR